METISQAKGSGLVDIKLIDHRYEYELLAGFWTSTQAAISILINVPSALVVGAGGAGLMAAVGLA